MALPIDVLKEDVRHALEAGPVVLTSPTGSGKSTQVPRWCSGRVVVVEPRRVACRSLAERVASLEGTQLGEDVGYHVRDDRCASDATRILFATPGIVLQDFRRITRTADTVVLDELHERRLDVDLLLALLQGRYAQGNGPRLIAMSATLDGDRVAAHLRGTHLHVDVRTHPIDVRHHAARGVLPTREDLGARVVDALRSVRDDPGDVLVFLPGKGEIAEAADAIGTCPELRGLRVVPLHGGLSLSAQRRAFERGEARTVVLATNVAETSLTLPGIGVVIDAGLVRRTRYHRGRGFLTLAPIAEDAADQRAGRAGRTGPGVCVRMWARSAKLDTTTPPEMHRESLVPLVLAAAGCGADARTLPFLDEPKAHALEAAFDELTELGALDAEGTLTDEGRAMSGLPLDAPLARFLIQATRDGTTGDAIDVVAALMVGRPLFVGPVAHAEDDLRERGCDATAFVRALREGDPARHGLDRRSLEEARANATRLRRALDVRHDARSPASFDRRALARTAIRADPRVVHVRRTRGKRVAWSNGGTELELGRETALARAETTRAQERSDARPVETAIVLDSRAIGLGARNTRVLITCAMPVDVATLVDLGVGRERVAQVRREDGRIIATLERVYAKKVLAERDAEPTGALARDAIATLFLRGSIFKRVLPEARERLASRALAARLGGTRFGDEHGLPRSEPPPALDAWVRDRLEELGVERGEDLALLSPEDLLPDPLPFEVRHVVDAHFPRQVDLGDARYAVDYDLEKRQAVLRIVHGRRDKPPPLSFLPSFPGFRICVEAGRTLHVLRR